MRKHLCDQELQASAGGMATIEEIRAPNTTFWICSEKEREHILSEQDLYWISSRNIHRLIPYCSFLSVSRSSRTIILNFWSFFFSFLKISRWTVVVTSHCVIEGRWPPHQSWLLLCITANSKATLFIRFSLRILSFLMDPDCTIVNCVFMAESLRF